MARPASKHPTDGELEILNVLWDLGPAGLGQVCTALRRQRSVATTTVATMLKLMLDKKLVKRTSGPRGYLWSARVSRKAATSSLLRKLLDSAFDGSARRLVSHMLEDGKLSEEDRQEVSRLLDAQAERKSPDRDTVP